MVQCSDFSCNEEDIDYMEEEEKQVKLIDTVSRDLGTP